MQLRASVTKSAFCSSRGRKALHVCNFQSSPKTAPLIDRLGGPSAVRTAVDKFYVKVLDDDRVNHYFAHTDMNKQRAHQAAFMTYAFGGTNQYSGKDMVAAHKDIIPHLEESHFDAIVEHFVATLKDMEVPQEDIDAAVAVVATTKDDILSRG